MQVAKLHRWRVSSQEAVEIQARLGRALRLEPLGREVEIVAGADVAYSKATRRLYAAVVAVRLPDFEVIETATACRIARFPYVPGLFSFRELPPLLPAFEKLRCRPDAVFFDGQGLAHPRRFGLACHGGVLLGTPSLGCAKSRLVGQHGPVPARRGGRADLRHGGDVVGAAVRTRTDVAPVFVSPGHLMDVDSAVELVLRATGHVRVPEPLRRAHRASTELLRGTDPALTAARGGASSRR